MEWQTVTESDHLGRRLNIAAGFSDVLPNSEDLTFSAHPRSEDSTSSSGLGAPVGGSQLWPGRLPSRRWDGRELHRRLHRDTERPSIRLNKSARRVGRRRTSTFLLCRRSLRHHLLAERSPRRTRAWAVSFSAVQIWRGTSPKGGRISLGAEVGPIAGGFRRLSFRVRQHLS